MAEGGDEKLPVKIEILSITIDSQITPCLGNTPVKTPNWEPGIDLNDGPGSTRPGIFEISEIAGAQSELSDLPDMSEILECIDEFKKNEGLQRRELIKPFENQSHQQGGSENDDKKCSKLIVTVTVKDPGAFEKAFLVGELGGMIFIGKITIDGSSSPERPVNVVPLNEPASFKRIWGDMGWYLVDDKGKKHTWIERLEETRIEIFWIYGYPGKMYKKGVWIEVLRFLEVECFGLEYEEWIIRRIVNYCHSGAGLRYDSYIFSHYYGLIGCGGAFDLKAYLEKAHPLCNCFDQAGALQALLGALGIEVDWVLMDPFGYLNETNLVGRGRCNNPGFLGKSLKDIKPELLPKNHPHRTGFGGHAFCIWPKGMYDMILDACAGPHFGVDTSRSWVAGYKQTYIDLSVDGLTSLYSQGDIITEPGKLDDMNRDCHGVIDVSSVTRSPFDKDLRYPLPDREKRKIKEFMKRIDFDKARKDISIDKGVVADWPDSFDWLGLEDIPWTRKFKDFRNNLDIAVREWSLIGAHEYINVMIYVANNIESASNRLIILALSTTLRKVPFERKPQQLRHLGHLHVYWYSPYFLIDQWQFYNVFIKIIAYNPSIDMYALAQRIQEKAGKHVTENFLDYLPVIENIHVLPPGKIRAGEEVKIEVHPAADKDLEALMLDFFFASSTELGEHLRLLEESTITEETNSCQTRKFVLTFAGRSPGVTGVQLVLVNRKKLLCSKPWGVTVNVI